MGQIATRPEPHRLFKIASRDALVGVGLFGVALVLRAVFLGDRQLFRDEAASWLLAQYPFPELITHARAEPYPPLYGVVLRGWEWLFGDSETALRSLSSVFGLAMVLVGWHWATESLGRRAGLIALAALAVSPLAIANSRDVRMYAMDAAWTTLSWWLTWRIASGRSQGGRRRIDAAALAAAIAAELWTFSIGLPVAALQFAAATVPWVLDRRRENALAPTAIIAGGVAFLPWLPTTLANAGGHQFWTPTPKLDDLRESFTLMAGGWDLPWVLGSSCVLIGAAVGVVVILTSRVAVFERPGTAGNLPFLGVSLVAGLGLVPVVWLYSQFHSFYDTRYLGAALAPFALASAAGTCWLFHRLPLRRARIAAAITVALLVAGGVVAWLGAWKSEVGLAPARELLGALDERMRPGDVALAIDARSYFQIAYLLGRERSPDHIPGPLFTWASGSEPFYYGQSLLSGKTLVSPSEISVAGWGTSLPGLSQGGRIWLIALANGAGVDLGFRPLQDGQLGEVGRILMAPSGEAGQLLELVLVGHHVDP